MQRKLQREVQARKPGEHIGIIVTAEMYKHACTPGANVEAVWFRVSMLGMLEMLGRWIQDGVPADAVFKVAATFPMKGMPTGVPQEGLPFEVQEFMSQVAKS